jgi:two-component system, chemotaxis family, protein-glutamate methylesterase/glutaminase
MPSKIKYKSGPIIVAGASAGGLRAFVSLIRQLPEDFPGPLRLVQHLSADASGNTLLDALNGCGTLQCKHAANGLQVRPGHAYLAPSDHHIMGKKNGELLVTKGAQENRYRPAIDPLFRSAAVAFGNKVTGILLTGYLAD